MRDRAVVTPGLVAGILAIGAGVILLLDRNDVFYAHHILRFFFPALLIAAGIFRLAQPDAASGRAWGGVLTTAGVVLTLHQLGYVRLNWGDLWPLGLIAIGVLFLVRALETRHGPTYRPLSWINAWTVFGGGEIRTDAKDFLGGEVMAVFGGYSIDLRKAAIQNGEAVLNASVIFGGIEIKVPENWLVSVQGAPVLGGFSDTTHKPDGTEGPAQTLVLRGVALFGGVDIKN